MSNPLLSESPDEVTLTRAARAALLAEIQHIRTARKPVFVLPAEDQVVRLIAAAWPVLAGAGETSG
jgi:hypothetical protein